MNIVTFHRNLLGENRHLTPEAYWLTDRHQALYAGFSESGIRGFAGDGSDREAFLGTLVLALCQTGGQHRVVLVVPQHKQKWASARIKEVARYLFRSRKGNLNGVRQLRDVFRCLSTTPRPFQLLEEPERWVIFGYEREALLPDWVAGKLL